MRLLVAALAALTAGACAAAGTDDDSGSAGGTAVAGAAAQGARSGGERPAPIRIGYALGSPDAPIQVVEFSDLGCTSCSHFARRSFAELREEFIETGRVQWRYVLLDRGFPNGVPAARAARCAARQERFWEMRALLAEEQRDWIARRRPADRFGEYAARLGLDADAFAACHARPDGRGMSTEEMVALQLGIRAVPTFLVDGQQVIGALTTEQFRAILLRALEAR